MSASSLVEESESLDSAPLKRKHGPFFCQS